MSTYTITHDNAYTGDMGDYTLVTSAQFADKDVARYTWMSEVQDSQRQAMADLGYSDATLLVWRDGEIISTMVTGNRVAD